MFGGYRASDDFREGAQLLVGVHGFDRYVNVNPRCAGSFQEAGHAQCFQLFMKRSSDRDGNGEMGALGRIKIEKEIIGMVEIGVAAGPGIVVDATEAGEEEEGSAIVGCGVVDFFAQASFRIDRNCFEPLRNTLAQIFLKEGLALDSVGIAAKDQRSIAEKRQNGVGYSIVIGEEISFRVSGLGKIDFVQVTQAEAFAVEFDRDRFRMALEQFGFDLRSRVEHATDNFGRANHGGISRGSGDFSVSLAIDGPIGSAYSEVILWSL